MASPVVHFILATPNPCALATLNLRMPREEALRRYEYVAEEMSTTGPQELRLRRDFDISELSVDRIKRVYRLLDSVFYNSTLFAAIAQKQVLIFWEYFPFQETPQQACQQTTVISSDSNPPIVKEIHFQINKNRYGDSAKYRTTNGIRVRHKMEALCASCMHEIAHAITYVFCDEERDHGHSDTFLSLNHGLHGGDKRDFEYHDDIPGFITRPALPR